jgi:hypothetical protein
VPETCGIRSLRAQKSDEIDDSSNIVVDFYSRSSSFRGDTLIAAERFASLQICLKSHSKQHRLSGRRNNLRWLIANNDRCDDKPACTLPVQKEETKRQKVG